jgi:hypothetical protein
MELGDPLSERVARSDLDVILDNLNHDFAELVGKMESGGLDHLSAAEKINFWQRFETFRTGCH